MEASPNGSNELQAEQLDWSSALSKDALDVIPQKIITAVDAAPEHERNQLLHRIQIIAAERYDSLARAYFQRQWQLAQLQAMHDYQERAADVRFVEATEKIVDEWQSATSNYRHTRSDTTGRGGSKARRRTAVGTGSAAAAGGAASDKTPRWTYAQQSPLEFPLSAVEILSDMKAMHIDWKVRAVRFAMHPNRPRYPVEVKRDVSAAARATSAAVPAGAAAGNVLHYCGETLRPGDDVRVVATLTADEFVCRLLRVTHAEVIVGLPDGSKSRIPTVHLVNGRFTVARLAVPHLPPRPEGMVDPPSPPLHAAHAALPAPAPSTSGYTNTAPRSSASMHAALHDELPSITPASAAQTHPAAPPHAARARAPSHASAASSTAPLPAGGTKRARTPSVDAAGAAGAVPPTPPQGAAHPASGTEHVQMEHQHAAGSVTIDGSNAAKRPRTQDPAAAAQGGAGGSHSV